MRVDSLPTRITRADAPAQDSAPEIVSVPTQSAAPVNPLAGLLRTGISPNLDRVLGMLAAFGEAYLQSKMSQQEAIQMQTMSQPVNGTAPAPLRIDPNVVREAIRAHLPRLAPFREMTIADAISFYPTIETQVVGQITAELNRLLAGVDA